MTRCCLRCVRVAELALELDVAGVRDSKAFE